MTFDLEIEGFVIFSYSIRRLTLEERLGESTVGSAGVKLLIGAPGVKNGREGTLGLADRKS